MRIKLIEAKCSEQSQPMENVLIITTCVIKHKLCFTRSLPAWMENPTPIWPNVSHEGLEKGGRNLVHMCVSKGESQLLDGEEPGQEGTEGAS